MMDIGSLEYVVISFEDDQFAHEILPELNAIQEKGLIRVVDLLFVIKDTDRLAEEIPPGTSAVIILLEHTWAFGLAEAVRRAGGKLFTGGLVTPEALTQVRAELAAAKEENNA